MGGKPVSARAAGGGRGMDSDRVYRVEHRTGGRVSTLGRLDGCPRHHATLVPYASQLRLAGRADGELVLVEDATDHVVARRHLDRGAGDGPERADSWPTAEAKAGPG